MINYYVFININLRYLYKIMYYEITFHTKILSKIKKMFGINSVQHKYPKKDTIQLSNLCFLFTKIGQLAVFLYFGTFTMHTFEISLLSLLAIAVGLFFGVKLKRKIDKELYKKILQGLLFIIASMLVVVSV